MAVCHRLLAIFQCTHLFTWLGKKVCVCFDNYHHHHWPPLLLKVTDRNQARQIPQTHHCHSDTYLRASIYPSRDLKKASKIITDTLRKTKISDTRKWNENVLTVCVWMWRQHAGEQQNMQFSNVQQQESITMHMVEWKKKRKKWSLIAADEQLETEQICSVFHKRRRDRHCVCPAEDLWTTWRERCRTQSVLISIEDGAPPSPPPPSSSMMTQCLKMKASIYYRLCESSTTTTTATSICWSAQVNKHNQQQTTSSDCIIVIIQSVWLKALHWSDREHHCHTHKHWHPR